MTYARALSYYRKYLHYGLSSVRNNETALYFVICASKKCFVSAFVVQRFGFRNCTRIVRKPCSDNIRPLYSTVYYVYFIINIMFFYFFSGRWSRPCPRRKIISYHVVPAFVCWRAGEEGITSTGINDKQRSRGRGRNV